MPRKTEPIDDESLAGLIMAVTAEAQRAGWLVLYNISDNGTLVLHLKNPEKRFAVIDAESNIAHLIIERVTAEKELIDG